MNHLDYAPKGLKQPRAPDHRSPVERWLDRIFLALVLPIVVAVYVLIVVLLVGFVAWIAFGSR